MIQMKKKNGVDIISKRMKKRTNKQKQKKYRKNLEDIDSKLDDKIAIAEAKLLLHILIHHFDGFVRQQQLINTYMSSKYHWGNKRTARVLKTLKAIGVIERWKAESDNWTLFFLVKGFIETCKERIIRAGNAITERIKLTFSAITSLAVIQRLNRGLS